jgi:microcystin-dependent protein
LPFIGSAPNKTFQRTDGTRTGSQTWQEADAAGVDIVSDDHDTHDQDIADGLNQALLKDGGNTATANIPMGGFRFSNLGDATTLNQAVTARQFLNNSVQYCSVGGTANTVALSTGFSATAYTAGFTVSWVVGATNTGPVTINVDNIGAKALVRADGAHTALQAGDLPVGALVEAQYDGTRFQLRSPATTSTSADVLARIVRTGTIVAWAHSTVPAGWLECYGQAISRTTYAELYAAIGTTYGVGDGSTTFNLPDLRGRSIFGEDDMGGSSADRITTAGAGFDGDTLGATGGAETVTLTIDQMPSHNHDITDPGHVHNMNLSFRSTPFDNSGSDDNEPFNTSRNTLPAFTGITINNRGGGQAHNNMPPSIILKWIILALPAAAAASTLGVHGLQYTWNTATSGDPGSGHLLVNNATVASATALHISETDGFSAGVSSFLATWDDSSSTLKGFIHVSKVGAPGTFAIFSVSGSLTDNGGYDTFTVSHIASAGTLANGDSVSVLFYRNGDKGDQGEHGVQGDSGIDAGVRFNFDDDTSMADPGTGDIRLNNADFSSVTAIAVSDLSAETGNPDVSAFVLSWDDSTTTSDRGTLIIKNISAPENFAIYSISGASTDNSGWTELAVTHVASSGSFTDEDALSVAFTRTGNLGASGSNGIDGTDGGIRWTFDDSTTTNADPGSGDIRLNNASFASVTEIAISYASGESGNPDVEDFVKAWDDSTTTTNRGTLIIKSVAAPENFAIYSITSSITDGTTYGRFTISHLASSGSFSASDVLSVQFSRTGDKGTDGLGTGDVTAASGFGTDNVLIRSDGTSKGVQATGISVDDSDNVSGVNNVTGADADFVTGTAGTDGNLVSWNSDGDAVDSGVAASDVLTSGGALGTPSSGTLTNCTGLPLSGVVDSTSEALGVGSLELGHASDTTLTRSAAGKLDVEGHTVLTDDQEDQGPIAGGASVTPKDLGTVSTGTITPDPGDRCMQFYTNNGAHTLGELSAEGASFILITNGASAGAITTSGWDRVDGDPFTTSNGARFECFARRWGTYSILTVRALQ